MQFARQTQEEGVRSGYANDCEVSGVALDRTMATGCLGVVVRAEEVMSIAAKKELSELGQELLEAFPWLGAVHRDDVDPIISWVRQHGVAPEMSRVSGWRFCPGAHAPRRWRAGSLTCANCGGRAGHLVLYVKHESEDLKEDESDDE